MDETPLRRRLGLDKPSQAAVEESAGSTGWERDPGEHGEERAATSVRGVVKELLETAIFILLVFLIVRGVIQNFKIDEKRFQTIGHGPDNPVAANTTEAGRQQNRRTDIKVVLATN